MRAHHLRRRYARTRRASSRVREGVPYAPWTVAFTTRSGKKVRKVMYSPGRPWVAEEVCRYLDDRGDVDASQPVYLKEGRR